LNANEIQIDSASVDDIDHQTNISKAFLTPFLRAICRARSNRVRKDPEGREKMETPPGNSSESPLATRKTEFIVKNNLKARFDAIPL
jgi:hypothetical protein